MSIIIKNRIGREIEIPRPLSTIVKTLGITDGMSRENVDEILKQASIHTVANGNSRNTTILEEAIEELETWQDETVHVDL